MTVVIPGQESLTRPRAGVEDEHALELLSGMAVSLGLDVDLDSLLAELAVGVRRALDADRVSVLLLDDANRLSPAVAVARQHDDELWQRFRRMPPIALDDLPGARQALTSGKMLVINDASASPLVPSAWQRTFALGSLAIAPLVVADAPVGLVAVDYAQVAVPFTPTQLALLEGMAALAGIALRGGREGAQVQGVETVAGVVRAMAAARTSRAVGEQSLAVLLETAGVGHGLFALLARDGLEVVAVRGPGLPEPGRYAMTELPARLVDTCREAWTLDPRAPVAVEVAGRTLTALPIGTSKGTVAVVLLPVAVTSLRPRALAGLQLIADATGMALHAVRLADDRDWHRRVLSLTSAATFARPGGVVRIAHAARALLGEVGVGQARVVTDRSVARVTGLSPAVGEVARQLTRWRRTAVAGQPVQAGGESVVALRAGERLVGALLWPGEAGATPGRRAGLVVTVLGDTLGRALADHRAEELERAAADAAAHRAVATRAYREAGQVLGLLADHLRGGDVDGQRVAAARALADQARRLVRDATEVLAPTTARQPGLRTALTATAQQVFAHGGPQTVVRQSGRVPGLDPAVQVAVLRVTQRILVLLREARATAAAVHVEVRDGDVTVTVRADELLAAALDTDAAGLHAALRGARAWLGPVGGSLNLVRTEPVNRFVVRAPLGVRRPEHRNAPP